MRYTSCFTFGILTLLLLPAVVPIVHAQHFAQQGAGFAAAYEQAYREAGSQMQQQLPIGEAAVDGSKSGFLAILYSLAVPGLGELYAGRFDKGKYPMIVEAGLWLGLLGVNSYGNWVEEDARIYAIRHAGIEAAGKDDKFFVNIENYSDLYDYNNQRLVERRFDEVYPDEAAWRWAWDSEEHRLDYKDQRIKADELHNAVSFFVLGMVANRIWSAIQAAVSVKDYNSGLLERMTTLPQMDATLTSRSGRTDGISLNFRW